MAQNNVLPQPIEQALNQLGGAITPEAHLTDVLAAFETILNALQDSSPESDAPANTEIQAIKDQLQASSKKLTALPMWNLARLKEAEEEVSTVVNATETATDKIMEHAEAIMNADSSNPEAYNTCVMDAVMQIFEACSFQDITGQRLARVSDTLNDMEEQAVRTMNVIGADEPTPDSEFSDRDQRKHDLLLHGPSNEGEGVSQEDIDALFD